MLRIGVVGYGYWGPNLVRNIQECSGSAIGAICDASPVQRDAAHRRWPGTVVTDSFDELLDDPEVEAVAIATPVATHFDLARRAFEAGKHVWVEKPMAATSNEAAELVRLAENSRRVLLVDHTFVYTAAVRKMRSLIESGDLGEVYYYDATRVNLGLFQHDVNVIWDLAVHDLSILEYILPVAPIAVSATGTAHLSGQPEDVAFLTLFFEGSLIAHVNVNWLSPVKVRRTLLGGSDKMVVYDDLEPSEKIKIYDRGIDLAADKQAVYKILISYRTGDMLAPKLDSTEALRNEIEHFVRCVGIGETPLTGGASGLRIVRLLEAATESLGKRGGLVEL